ncbi:hypothetical protein A9Q99_05735 [Gammaproteobacteria bacterium 45_16_T64]|nr:hypothetical protein A9Q99_05735 [Gammaproteobacteria bacterium 45_16_T64]
MIAQNKLSQHAEWLSLVEVSGPFLAEPILKDAFPQGLEKIDPFKKKQFRQTYEEWREVIDSHDEDVIAIKNQIHKEWINWVIKFGLEWDEDEDGDILKTGDALPETIQLTLPEHGVKLKPEFAVYADEKQKPYLLLTSYPPDTKLEEVVKGESWSTTPAERMAQLCRSVGARLGVITNGEQWLFIDAPEGGITTYASWYARLWSQEPVTLQAFYSLLNIGTIFNGFEDAKKLTELLDESLKHQDEVTETLGLQVSRAVEVLIQSLDRINHDYNGKLLEGVEPTELYEAGLTLMMRLVFLLCAEERGLLLLGDETYESNYALSTLRLKLRGEASLHGEEVLSYRKNAWSRLLAIFRAVYGGIEHENMRMPALGGSLFDPDRFPFLEGRAKGSNWKIDAAKPLPIDNRTVLLFLDAIQVYKGRTLSYRALDVEQIGYVYEGLLEKTVARTPDVTLELNGSKSAKKPWVQLKELASAELDGEAAVKSLLKKRTDSSAGRIKTDLNKEISDAQLDKLLAACQNDIELRDRLKPYYHFLRLDAWDNPLLYPKDSFMVTTGTDRRETGTHYTPKSLTESIVKETLEPIVYVGPAEGKPKNEWQLKSSPELFDLKICDLAMGSGAFLVQVCRWLAERVCEAWLLEEQVHKYISAEGELLDLEPTELLPVDAEERLLIAKRRIAERCLYGVDINPLAVELAKLSIWLVTLSKGRPFGFLDHNLKHGDSLLGLHDLDQLYYLNMSPSKLSEGGGSAKQLFAQDIEKAVQEALDIRKQLRQMPIRDIHDVEVMANMELVAEEKLELPLLAANALVGEVLANKGKSPDTALLGVQLSEVFSGKDCSSLKRAVVRNLKGGLAQHKNARKPFHWCLEFPEVSENGQGFDAAVGNPPFVGDTKLRKVVGPSYRRYLIELVANGVKGKADLVTYFFLRQYYLLKKKGNMGLLARDTLSQGDSRKAGLDQILSMGGTTYRANTSVKWPGKASIMVHQVHISKGGWNGLHILNGQTVHKITTYLKDNDSWIPKRLKSNTNLVFEGTAPNGEGFLVSKQEAENMMQVDSEYKKILYPYVIARQVNQMPVVTSDRWIINFWDWNEEKSSHFSMAFSYLENEVKPIRQRRNESGDYVLRSPLPQRWWQHKEKRPGLYHSIGRGELFEQHPSDWDPNRTLVRVLVMARGATKYPCFSMLENNLIFGDSLCVIASASFALFAVLSSDIHCEWAWQEGGRKNFDLRYTQESIFETFPFPEGVFEDSLSHLTDIGRKFLRLRSEYMMKNSKGLTSFYNDYHNPKVTDKNLIDCRSLQVELNRRVIEAYSWSDLQPVYGFYEVDYLPEGKNCRFGLNENAKAEILSRLSLLNKERYEAEFVSVAPIKKSKILKVDKEKTSQGSLF